MANENLRAALHDAGIQPDELAGIVGVDERTIRRWLAGGTPYARHRTKLARALDSTEPALWPHLAQTTAAEAAVAPATVTDAVAGFARADAPDAPRPDALIADASGQIDLLHDTSRELLESPGLTELIATKARGGCRVRILVCEPDQSLLPLLGAPGVEIRRSEIQERPVTHRVDDDALACVKLSTDDDEQSPILLHVGRDRAPGLFDRLADHYQHAWEHGEPIETADDIEHYLTEQDGDYDDATADEDDDADDVAPEAMPEPHPQQPATLATPVTRPPATAPRRWPGRPA